MPKHLPLITLAAAFDTAFPRRPNSSSVCDMRKAFWPLDRLIADLYAGDIAFAGADPVMIDHDGEYGMIVPSLEGWCSTMERIAHRLQLPLDIGHLRRLAKRLDTGMLLDVSDIDRAAQLVDRCRAIFLACPVYVRQQATNDELIEIYMSEIVREAA